MSNIDSILSKIQLINSNWLTDFSQLMPNLVAAKKQNISSFKNYFDSGIINLYLFLLDKLPIRPIPKYIFQGLRHQHLIEQLPAQEVMVLGGRQEYWICRKKNWRFRWNGYIGKAFNLFIYGNNKIPFENSIKYLLKIFNSTSKNDSDKNFLFLWEDSKPIGITLSVICATFSHINTVCIAHGMFPLYRTNRIPPEGTYCKFNLVWATSQTKLFRSSINQGTYVLGLPYEKYIPLETVQKVILVGHCGRNSDHVEYFYSLYHFTRLYRILQKANIEVAFRPHPMDDLTFIETFFPCLCTMDKKTMFSEGRKIYVGFSSTLLFEAKAHENAVIQLDDSIFPYTIDFEADKVVPPSEYESFPEIVLNLFENLRNFENQKKDDLQNRFNYCVNQIEATNLKVA